MLCTLTSPWRIDESCPGPVYGEGGRGLLDENKNRTEMRLDTYKISEDEFKLSLVHISHQIQRFSCPSLFL